MTPAGKRGVGSLSLALALLTQVGCGSSPAVLGTAANPATPTAEPSQTPDDQHHSCGPRPAEATAASLETRLSFPDVVTDLTPGTLTVRNAGSSSVAISLLPVVAVSAESIMSWGVMDASSSDWQDIAPGQEQHLVVSLSGLYQCTNGRTHANREIPDGQHQLVAIFMLADGKKLVSSGTNVTYRSPP